MDENWAGIAVSAFTELHHSVYYVETWLYIYMPYTKFPYKVNVIEFAKTILMSTQTKTHFTNIQQLNA